MDQIDQFLDTIGLEKRRNNISSILWLSIFMTELLLLKTLTFTNFYLIALHYIFNIVTIRYHTNVNWDNTRFLLSCKILSTVIFDSTFISLIFIVRCIVLSRDIVRHTILFLYQISKFFLQAQINLNIEYYNRFENVTQSTVHMTRPVMNLIYVYKFLNRPTKIVHIKFHIDNILMFPFFQIFEMMYLLIINDMNNEFQAKQLMRVYFGYMSQLLLDQSYSRAYSIATNAMYQHYIGYIGTVDNESS